MQAQYFLRRLGIYRNLSNATISYSNITFRMVGGLLGGLPLESIAFFTAVERLLWMFMEFPGGSIADRWGRLKVSILGFSLILLGNLCAYLAYLNHSFYHLVSTDWLIAGMGIFIGIGGPFMSASVEAYYQEKIEEAQDKEGGRTELSHESFSLSLNFGKYIPMLYVLLSFLVLYFFDKSIGAGHSFLVFILLDLYLIFFIYKDLKTFGDLKAEKENHTKPKELLRLLFTNKTVALVSSLNVCIWLLLYLTGYYFLLSIGREGGFIGVEFWLISLCSCFFMQGFAPVLRGSILPWAIQRFPRSWKNISYAYLWVLALSTIGAFIVLSLPKIGLIAGVFLILLCILIDLPNRYSLFTTNNLILRNQKASDYAGILSLKIVPAQMLLFSYSYFLSLFMQGAPSVTEAYFHMGILGLISMAVIFLGRRLV